MNVSHRRRRHRLSTVIERMEFRRLMSVTGTFELDGNVTRTTTHDWDQVYADNNVTPPPVSGAVASSFVSDKFNSTADDIFTGGGSKDIYGIQKGQWLFTGSKPQGKDDITHAYAAAYNDRATDIRSFTPAWTATTTAATPPRDSGSSRTR